ncbi:MAG: sodium:glutamate symporter, partial [Spirochaetales bacterium]
MNFEWMSFVEFGIIALALVIGTFFRAKIKFFQKFMIPNSITAGIILLLFYSLLAPKINISTKFLENLVYHLVNISFVAMALRKPGKRKHEKRPAFATAMNILSVYVIQGALGLILTFIFIKTFIPGLFPSFGFFIPLGFALGPGQAFAIGQKWEAPAYGFEGSGSVGLTFAAVGFFWAIFGGVFLINLAIRKGWIKPPSSSTGDGANRSGLLRHDDKFPIGAHLTTQSEAIETFAFNISIIFIVYLAAFLFLKLLTFLLSFAGPMGMSLAESFWGISFIFATLFGLIGRKVIDLFRVGHILENGTLTRTTGLSVDFMVAASIGAISVKFVLAYWIPILVMCATGGIVTLVFMVWMSSRVYTDHKFERMIL